ACSHGCAWNGHRLQREPHRRLPRICQQDLERGSVHVHECGPDSAGAAAGRQSSSGIAGFQVQSLEDRWILSRFNRVAEDMNAALETYRFHEAANRIYDFFWGEFCDWYLELIKPRLTENAEPASAEIACKNLVGIFEAAL